MHWILEVDQYGLDSCDRMIPTTLIEKFAGACGLIPWLLP